MHTKLDSVHSKTSRRAAAPSVHKKLGPEQATDAMIGGDDGNARNDSTSYDFVSDASQAARGSAREESDLPTLHDGTTSTCLVASYKGGEESDGCN